MAPRRPISTVSLSRISHQQDVRILAQGGAQHLGEGEAYLGIDLHLVDAGQSVLYRVLPP